MPQCEKYVLEKYNSKCFKDLNKYLQDDILLFRWSFHFLYSGGPELQGEH